mgnify:CR=1 FL=1
MNLIIITKQFFFMRTISKVTALLLLVLVTGACTQQKRKLEMPDIMLTADFLIPHPVEITATNSSFPLDQYTAISTSGDEGFQDVALFLAEKIKATTSLDLQVNPTDTKGIETLISIQLKNDFDSDNPEAYKLEIRQDSILLHAASAAGAFRGIQTLRQLIPEQSNDDLADYSIWTIPTGEISDAPQFSYRSAMLDVARHFFSVEDVKRYIDLLSYYKINNLHLHLTDDQGWRIEIKSWPKLTEIGSTMEVGGGKGGFYTQEEYTDIVNYAARRHINIVPEIDMPGHTNAASLSYPILDGSGKELKLYTGIEVGFSTFDTRKDTVYAFIDDVIRELAALTPGPYIHIGGDESHATKKDDFNYFIERATKIVEKHGKKMIGWDEVVHADIDGNSIVQYWNKKENAQKGVEKGMQVILSPASKAYLDMKYDENSEYGLVWAGYIPVDVAYNWSPETFAEIPMENILGVEAPLWSETISNFDELAYLAFPRVIGYAELGWTIQENRNWNSYKNRLANQAPFLKREDVKFYRSELVDWKE